MNAWPAAWPRDGALLGVQAKPGRRTRGGQRANTTLREDRPRRVRIVQELEDEGIVRGSAHRCAGDVDGYPDTQVRPRMCSLIRSLRSQDVLNLQGAGKRHERQDGQGRGDERRASRQGYGSQDAHRATIPNLLLQVNCVCDRPARPVARTRQGCCFRRRISPTCSLASLTRTPILAREGSKSTGNW